MYRWMILAWALLSLFAIGVSYWLACVCDSMSPGGMRYAWIWTAAHLTALAPLTVPFTFGCGYGFGLHLRGK